MGLLLTADEFLQRYDDARQHRIPPYNWIPPMWEGKDPPVLKDNVSDDVLFPDPKLEKRENENQPGEENPDSTGQLKKMPHPFSDFSHIDPNQFDETDFTVVKKKLGATSAEFRKLKKFLGPESLGMQRLGRVFEWALIQATKILGDLNKALLERRKTDYNNARQEYIDLIKDLDDHEPHTKNGKVVPGVKGYGATAKWAYIDPVIRKGVITGACVVLLWNPHSSSSGVPIGH